MIMIENADVCRYCHKYGIRDALPNIDEKRSTFSKLMVLLAPIQIYSINQSPVIYNNRDVLDIGHCKERVNLSMRCHFMYTHQHQICIKMASFFECLSYLSGIITSTKYCCHKDI